MANRIGAAEELEAAAKILRAEARFKEVKDSQPDNEELDGWDSALVDEKRDFLDKYGVAHYIPSLISKHTAKLYEQK